MKLWMLPFVREGIAPTQVTPARSQARISMRLEAPGRTPRDIVRAVELLGPGDVVAIEARQVLRSYPAPGARDAEPEFFPLVEFDGPDLPWAYSPSLPQGPRLLPWISLVVIEAQPGVTVDRGEQGQSPWILRLTPEIARVELPDLSDAWAWAHAQVACAADADIATTLAQRPDQTLSRLLSPRRLLPNRAYHACVVPAFQAGRLAGLGGDPSALPSSSTGGGPAWNLLTDLPRELPVYHTWSFRTGAAGDFESLAQRLRPTPLDAATPPVPLQLALPDAVPPGASRPAVDWEAPLRIPGSAVTRPRRPSAATKQITTALKGGTNPPVLGPPYFGSSWQDDRPLTPPTSWAPELNLTPMWRAAAGLGAEAVRGEQESIVAAASEQLEAFRTQQRQGRRKQLAVSLVNRVKTRIARAPTSERARVFAPLLARAQAEAADVGLFMTAGRRITRKTWRTSFVRSDLGSIGITGTVAMQDSSSPAPARPPSIPVDSRSADLSVASVSPTPGLSAIDLTAPEATLAEIPGSIPAVLYRAPIDRVPVVAAALPLTLVALEPASTNPTGTFAPRFARPMSEVLAGRFPELMVPGAGTVPAEGVLLVESDPAFVEAFLVGANQEINYELLWRGLPADGRATPFRRFWPHADAVEDVDDIATWSAADGVGTHVNVGAAMVFLVRGEIVRRYPSMLLSAVPAKWTEDGSRTPVTDRISPVLPVFRGSIGDDILYAGFEHLSLGDATGSSAPSGNAGWFILLGENPGDPRFGLDPQSSAPPTRATLSWNHLSMSAGASYAALHDFPNVPDAFPNSPAPNFSPVTATSAGVASLVRQRPFRVFLHASLLVRPRV